MAKTSDFAQKLLDDLRLRKERLAASQSQRSNQSNQISIDAYAYNKQTYRSSKNVKASNLQVTPRNGDTSSRPSSRSHRTPNTGEASNQMVVYGRGQSSVQLSDISLALTYAFDNGGKLKRGDPLTSSMMSFLNQIKRGTMEYNNMGRGNNVDRQLVTANQFPTFSPGQINEISKGVQKLNKILIACSNGGVNMGRYSMEFAKELLQGAMNLEESLRMLVDMQKSSDSMKNSQTKNRITLLEDDDEDDGDKDYRTTVTSEHRQLVPPTFSFDRSLRNSHKIRDVGSGGLMQKQLALTYSKERKNLSNEKQDVNTSKLLPHRQSTSSISDCKNPKSLSEERNLMKSNTRKARIPNVIATLMGLDNIPEKKESGNSYQKDSGSAKRSELNSKRMESLVPPKQQKVVEPVIRPKTQEKELMYGEGENLIIRKESAEVAVKNRKTLWRELNETKASKGLEKQHNNYDEVNKVNRESGKEVQANGRKQVQATNREQKVVVKGRTNDFLLNNMLAHLEKDHEKLEFDSSLQEEKVSINGIVLQPVKKNTYKEATNQKKSQNHLGVQKHYALSKYGPQQELHRKEKKLQHHEKHLLDARVQNESETALKKSSKPSHDLTNTQKKKTLISHAPTFKPNFADNVEVKKPEGFLVRDYIDLKKDEASNEFNVKVKQVNNRKSGQISSPRYQQSEPFTGKHSFTTMMDGNSVHKIATEKVNYTRKKKADPSENIEEVLRRRNGTMVHSTGQVKQRSPILKEVRRTSEFDQFNLSKEAKQGGKVHELQESADLFPNNLHQDVKSVATDDKQDVATLLVADERFESCASAPTWINGEITGKYQKRVQEPLTESENFLKWILVTSQQLLNTAEALFKLKIPFNILQGCGVEHNEDEESRKLILDCSYEVVKRKGIRQELKVHPCSKASISPFKIRSLDDLVRQLSQDMEKLKFYGRNKTSSVHVEDYHPKMLEHDVYNKYPDIDSMWDLGWNQETFAFLERCDVTRDIEKQILNELLDEITRELSIV